MQFALGGALVFAVLWFLVLRPKDPAVPVSAAPVATTPVETPRADAGGAKAETATGKLIETAKDGAASADSDTAAREKLTGEDPAAEASAVNTPSTAPSTSSSSAPAAASTAAAGAPKAENVPAAGAEADKAQVSAAQKRADRTILAIKKDLAARRAVVVLVWQKGGKEDTILFKRVRHEIDRRHGRVKTVFIKVGEVGRYDGLLSGLSLGQTPSTIVIAPNNEAKVLGGLTSVARIDRLTSSAILTKPAPTTP